MILQILGWLSVICRLIRPLLPFLLLLLLVLWVIGLRERLNPISLLIAALLALAAGGSFRWFKKGG